MTKLYVIELETGKTIHEVDVAGKSPRQIEKVMSGMLRNMDTERFAVSEKPPPTNGSP